MSNNDVKHDEMVQDAGELARLGIQEMLERQSRQEPPWLVPPGVVIEAGETILDLACSVGQWVLPVAREYPQACVMGLDRFPNPLLTMQVLAQARQLRNVRALQGDFSQPVEGIAPESVAFINARHLGGILPLARWASLLAECFSWLQPGGSICLCEAEWPVTTSYLCQHAMRQISLACLYHAESFSVSGQDLGLVPMLGRLLRGAGFEISGRQGLAWDLHAEEDLRQTWIESMSFGFRQTRPLLMEVLGYSEEHSQHLHQQFQAELERPDLEAIGFSLVLWARKPATAAPPQTDVLETTQPLENAVTV